MTKHSTAKVAIVDYGMCNLYSVKRACESAGLDAIVTSSPAEVRAAGAVILPGVGAFSDAMDSLRACNLIEPLRAAADSGRPVFGICLGMQLLMTESFEFGRHRGLDIVPGTVVRLESDLKVPQIGWNQIFAPRGRTWKDTLLEPVDDGEFMYFVHSFYVVPEDKDLALSYTQYGDVRFCSSLRRGNVFGCQFHPEKSGPPGLEIYRELAARMQLATSQAA